MSSKKHLNPELMAALRRLTDPENDLDRLTVEAHVQSAIDHINTIEDRLLRVEAHLVAFKSVVMVIQSSCNHLVTEPFFDEVTRMSGKICVNCQKIIQSGAIDGKPN